MAEAGDSTKSTFFRRFVLPGLAMKGVIIGGGYATGRELAEYFLAHGPGGAVLGMALAMLVWSAVAAVTFSLARRWHAFDYRTFTGRLLGPGWIAFEVCYLLFAVLLLAVFGAAAGEVLASLTDLPPLAGTLLLAGLTLFVAGRGEKTVEAMFKYVSTLLYAVYALFIVFALVAFGDRIWAGLAGFETSPGWFLGGVTYGSYNIVAAVMILPVLRGLTSPRDGLVAGALAGPMAMLPGFLFLLAMIGFHPLILAETLPSDFLLREIGQPWFRVAFQVMVFGALLESAVGVVHAVNERVATAWKKRRLEAPPARLRPLLTLGLLALCMFIAQAVGLVTLIASGYSVMAWVFLATFVVPVLTLGTWHLLRGDPASHHGPTPTEGPHHG